jgi:hypothetical protein
MHSRLALVAALNISLFTLGASADTLVLDPIDFSTGREKSMGGSHVALADDYSVLLTNPAGLADVPQQVSVADLGIQAIGPVFDIANALIGGSNPTTALVNFLAANDYKLYAGLGIQGPIAFGFTGGGLGFGLFNKTSMIVDVASATSINVSAEEDMLFTGGYAVRFDLGHGHELSAGMTAKGFVEGDVSTPSGMGIIEAVGLISNPTSLMSQPFTLTTGIGLDAGLRWAWKGLAAGLVCHDIYSPAIQTTYSSVTDFVSSGAGSAPSAAMLKRMLDAGFSWSPSLGRLGEVLDRLVIAIDYNDILDLTNPVYRNPILNVGLGVETRILEIVTLRAGINDALLSAGMGLDLGVFTINLAAYGTELGLDPGDRPYYNLLVDFDFKY